MALRVAASQRASGYRGTVVAVVEEPLLPFSWPPLSKAKLSTGTAHVTDW
jgi:hypothetical protein